MTRKNKRELTGAGGRRVLEQHKLTELGGNGLELLRVGRRRKAAGAAVRGQVVFLPPPLSLAAHRRLS